MLYTMIRWMTLLSLLSMCLSCSVAAPLKELPLELELESYRASGELESKRSIGSNEPVYEKLAVLLTKETGEWSRSRASYATGPFIFRGEGLIIRCYPDMVIVDVVTDGKSTSYKKNIPGVLGELGLSR
jgi:hypothetical protein